MTRILRSALLFTFALFALTLAPPPPPDGQLSLISRVHAATINVDSTCTINQAILSANGDRSEGSCEAGSGADTINISGSHTLSSRLELRTPITIIGSNNATINGNNQYRILDVYGGANATIRNVTLTNGRSANGTVIDIGSAGGTVVVENSVIHGNTTTSGGGPIDVSGGSLTIRNSAMHSNTNSNSSIISAGTLLTSGGALTIENSTFYNNTLANTSAGRVDGMQLSGSGTVITLTHVTIIGHYNSVVVAPEVGAVHIRNSIVSGTGRDCILIRTNTNQATLATNAGNLFADGTCSPKVSGSPKLGTVSGGVFPLREGSPAIDAADRRYCLSTDQRGKRRPQGKACDIGAYEAPAQEEEEKEEEPYIPPTPMPPTYTGEGFFGQTGIRVSATHGLRSGVQFKRIDASGIGLPEVLNNGFIDAVDVFGYVEQGVEVCFPQAGALIFLDAATSPRAVLPWPSTVVDGMTCGRITRPGTLVLVPSNSRLAGPVSTPQPAPGPQTSTGLSDCFVTTTHILNLRDTPNGDIIGRVNYKATLSATGRQGPWFQITVDGLSGWISADFTNTRGNCA